MFKLILFVGLGSFIGGVLRYLLFRLVHNTSAVSFPLGTLLVNVIGCFAIGTLYGLLEKGHFANDAIRMFLMVGLCGGFTTFSAFMAENFQLIRDGQLLYVLIYVGCSLFLGFLMLYLGYLLIKIA